MMTQKRDAAYLNGNRKRMKVDLNNLSPVTNLLKYREKLQNFKLVRCRYMCVVRTEAQNARLEPIRTQYAV